MTAPITPHLDRKAVEGFRDGTLPGEQLLAADAHLSSCRQCTELIDSKAIASFLSDLEGEDNHLAFEQLTAFADGNSQASDLEAITSHLEDCRMCAREAADLRTFAETLAPRSRFSWFAAAAVAAGVIVASLLATRHSDAPASPAAQFRDGGRQVTLHADGSLDGIDGLSPSQALHLATVLRSGSLHIPAGVGSFRHDSQLRGTTVSSAMEVLSPIGKVVVSDAPLFRWTAVPGSTYRVEVFDDQYHPVAESAILTTTSWTPSQELTRGSTYLWQVTAISGGRSMTSPTPPAPVARFSVLDARSAEAIARLEKQQPRSHLALGVAYAEAGAIEEAERELTIVAAENQHSPTARLLLTAVHAYTAR